MTGRRDHLERSLRAALDDREAALFVHAGSGSEPTIRYCLSSPPLRLAETYYAVAFDGDRWRVRSTETATLGDSPHPIERLLVDLDEERLGTALTPRTIPHDAALYLENAGFSLSSTDALEQARASKTEAEFDRLEAAQTAASAGIRRAAATLVHAERTADGSLAVGGESLTPARLRRELDLGVVAAGGYPTGTTRIDDAHSGEGHAAGGGALRAGVPLVLETTAREPGGYHGHVARTVVVDGEGGSERRAHVALTNALRSARSLLTAEAASVGTVEADLEAEVRAFGFDEGISTRVAGIGLEPVEGPVGGESIESGSVVRLEVAVDASGHRVRLADVLACGPVADGEPPSDGKTDQGSRGGEGTHDRPRWLGSLSRSLEPTALSECGADP